MLLIDIRSTNASAAEFILYRLKLYLAGRHHHQDLPWRSDVPKVLGTERFHETADKMLVNSSH